MRENERAGTSVPDSLPIEPTILLNVLHFIISLKILKLLITVYWENTNRNSPQYNFQ
jgi:hypothetical protein